ncbi:tripartite tricarboxylate transporter substrate binding protein [Candidimonas humi]|uniref:Bug family tripartite tricarboxylate transporter substrate binding protein n=1 Tax=Candidimonas humi TaxID=683355 RepID=A0ABV8NY98_9BURK|nr:tripartite tricarboxylate transporter substrate binding protein [Candidimonas humi]MBV6305639.1 tripartite tricarboxylate transporter substrate binding protein [Candidimonas humi]
MTNRRTVLKAMAGGAAAILLPEIVYAKGEFPQKPVRIIVPNPPGGASDVISRFLAHRLSKMWPQPVVVENRPGAGGSIGSRYVASQSNDGATLLMGGIASHAINPALYTNIGYDPVKDFTAVAFIGTLANVLMARNEFPATNIKELIDLARAAPGKYMYSSVGNGTSPHLSGALFCEMAHIQMVHVPYKGSAAALNDLLGGQISLGFDNLSAGLPYIKDGRIKALGVTTEQRSILLPQVPTIAESGVPGYEVTSWPGLFGPAGMDPGVTQYINESVNKVLQEKEFQQKLLRVGTTAKPMTPEEFSTFLKAQVQKYSALAKKAHLHLA